MEAVEEGEGWGAVAWIAQTAELGGQGVAAIGVVVVVVVMLVAAAVEVGTTMCVSAVHRLRYYG